MRRSKEAHDSQGQSRAGISLHLAWQTRGLPPRGLIRLCGSQKVALAAPVETCPSLLALCSSQLAMLSTSSHRRYRRCTCSFAPPGGVGSRCDSNLRTLRAQANAGSVAPAGRRGGAARLALRLHLVAGSLVLTHSRGKSSTTGSCSLVSRSARVAREVLTLHSSAPLRPFQSALALIVGARLMRYSFLSYARTEAESALLSEAGAMLRDSALCGLGP